MKLLLIDSRIDQLDTFVQGINETTEVIVYSYEDDTYDTIINQKNSEIYEYIGIVSHNYNDSTFQFLRKEGRAYFGQLNSWNSFINFLDRLSQDPVTIDLMACRLFSSEKWIRVFSYIQDNSNVTIRGSIDDTGNPEFGGNWVMESNNVNIRNLYFTDLITNYTGILEVSYNRYYGDYNTPYEDDNFMIASTQYGYAVLVKSLGKVWNVGYSNVQNGVWVIDTNNNILNNIVSVHSTQFSFCAINNAGEMYAWGFVSNGGSGTSGYADVVRLEDGTVVSGVVSIISTPLAFAAIDGSGYVYAWGGPLNGGINLIFATKVRIDDSISGNFLEDIVKLYSTNNSFIARDKDGYLYFWDLLSYATMILDGSGGTPLVLSSTDSIKVNASSIAILKSGDVYAFGSSETGGIDPTFATQVRVGSTGGSTLSGIVSVSSNDNAFSAIDETGHVYVWGDPPSGGIDPTFATQLRVGSTGGSFLSGIVSVSSNDFAFMGINQTGDVYVWGDPFTGGIDPTFATQLRVGSTGGSALNGIVSVSNNTLAFSAIHETGTVYVWGYPSKGGIDSTFATQLTIELPSGPVLTDIVSISPNFEAFGALNANGELYTWGSSDSGGNTLPTKIVYPSPIKSIIGNAFAFIFIDDQLNLTVFGSASSSGISLTKLNMLNVVEKTPILDEVINISTNRVNEFILNTADDTFVIGPPTSGGLNISYASKILDSSKTIVTNNTGNAVIVDGNVYVWGGFLSLNVPTLVTLQDGTPVEDIVEIINSFSGFSFRDSTGKVYAIGNNATGGINPNYATEVKIGSTGGSSLTGITNISSSFISNAFSAIGDSGTVYSWGATGSGGINRDYATQVTVGSSGPFLTDIESISSNGNSFTAIQGNTGYVYVWGNPSTGGINRDYATQMTVGSGGPFLSDVASIKLHNFAISALDNSGNVYAWGTSATGGINPNFATQLKVGSTGPFLSGVTNLYATSRAFAAIQGSTGYVYAWGASANGGTSSTVFATEVKIGSTGGSSLTGITNIESNINSNAFAALEGSTGYVYVWGGSTSGGINTQYATQVKVGSPTGAALSGIVTIASTNSSFAAIDDNGYVYAWGSSATGGISTQYATQITIGQNGPPLIASPLNKITSNSGGFAVLANDGQVYNWGFFNATGAYTLFASKINKFSFEPYVNPMVEATKLEVTYKDYEFTVGQILDKAVPNPDTKGIAVTSVVTTNGLWKYKTDSFWEDVPDVSETEALPLLADSSLQFIPSGSYDGSTEFSFKPWSGLIVKEEELFDSTIPNLGIVSQEQVDVTVNNKNAGAMSTILIIFGILIVIAVIFIFFAPTIIGFFSNLFSGFTGKSF